MAGNTKIKNTATTDRTIATRRRLATKSLNPNSSKTTIPPTALYTPPRENVSTDIAARKRADKPKYNVKAMPFLI